MRKILFFLVLALGLAAPAQASEILARNAVKPIIKVNKRGQALISYRSKGRDWHVLA